MATASQSYEPSYTFQEYLDFCENTGVPLDYEQGRIIARWGEFRAGEVLAMTGTTHIHGLITANITHTLTSQYRALLKKGSGQDNPCRVFGAGVVTRKNEADIAYQPDIVVVCGKVELGADGRSITNPHIIFEVLSPSTSKIDTSGKLSVYTGINSLFAYVVVHQDNRRIVAFVREDDKFIVHPIAEQGELSLGAASLNLDDVYYDLDRV